MHNRTEYSTSEIKADNDYLPGGTLITVLNQWTNRILNSEVDPTKIGRWSCMNLRGKEEKVISVYSVYRVSQDSLPDPFTTYAQQFKMMQDADHSDPPPRRQFITDLIKEIKQKQKTGKHQIILGIDANEVLEPDGEPVKSHSITRLKRECGLIDVFEHHHAQIGDTSNKKLHKIDHLLVSQSITPALIRSGFLPWGDVIASDHRTGFVDFQADILFGNMDDPTSSSARKLNTKYPKRVERYKEEVLQKFKDRNLFHAMETLSKKAKRREKNAEEIQ